MHGYCLKGYCVCKPGWKGSDCGIQACPNECNAHGRCVNSSCKCDGGWSGDACDAHTCPSDCNNHGACDGKTGLCKCEGAFKGADCSVAPESPRECGPVCVQLCLRQVSLFSAPLFLRTKPLLSLFALKLTHLLLSLMSSPVRPLRQGGSGCAADVLRQVHGQLPGPVRKECGPDYS